MQSKFCLTFYDQIESEKLFIIIWKADKDVRCKAEIKGTEKLHIRIKA